MLYVYCISTKLARCALIILLGLLMPMCTAMTIVGTVFYRSVRIYEPDCYPKSAMPWTLVMCLALGWFLTYIFILLGCAALY